jgi:hypothetical protein
MIRQVVRTSRCLGARALNIDRRASERRRPELPPEYVERGAVSPARILTVSIGAASPLGRDALPLAAGGGRS